MTLTVSQKGMALVALPLVFQLVFVLSAILFQRGHAAAGRLALHTKEVIAHVREINTRVSDAHASVRGYVIARDSAFANTYRDTARELPSMLDGLDALVGDNSGQTIRARSVRATAEVVIAWQGEIVELVRRGAGDEAAAKVGDRNGEAAMIAFRDEIRAFVAEEELLDRERVDALGRSRDGLTALFVTGGAAAIVGTLALTYAFRRGIVSRFARLEATARGLAVGQPVPPPLGGGDEIARLDRAFRSMAGDLTRASDTLRDLYDHAPCGYHSVGPDGVIVAANRTELQWLGYEADEVIGRMRFADLVSPVSREVYRRGFEQVREHGSVADVELDLVRKDGTTFPVLVSSTSARDANGGYLRSRTTLTDLTERKRAEEAVRRVNADLEGRLADLARTTQALRASEEQFRLLVEGVQDYAILMLDPDGRIASWNAGAGRIKGYTAREVVGRHFSQFYPPDVVARGWPERGLEVARADGRFEDEGWRVRKDGTTFWANVVITALRDDHGNHKGFAKVTRDITERKRAEAAVRLFADVAHNIPIGLLIYQLDAADPSVLRVRSGNRDAARLLGLTFEAASGRPVAEVFPAIPPDQLRRYAAVAATGEADDLGEFRYGDERVTERWWAVLAFPLPERCVGVAFQDVTARKRAEDEVRRLNSELEERVRERTAELEAANRELSQKNAENEMFVYSVSHDLRSPLVNLQGFSKELEKAGRQLAAVLDEDEVPAAARERARGVLGGKMATSLGFIQTAVLRLSGIIDALLRLSRAGRVEYRWGVLDVSQVVEQVVGAAQNTISERGVTVRVGELSPAWGDRTAVGQVFANLVGNALTYLDPARPGVIEIGCLAADSPDVPPGSRTYFVRDNGLGIADAHKQKIFQAFQRAHPGVGSGEGLGLAIVSRVVERHHGRVWVESTPGAGSAFFFTLPAPGGQGAVDPLAISGGV